MECEVSKQENEVKRHKQMEDTDGRLGSNTCHPIIHLASWPPRAWNLNVSVAGNMMSELTKATGKMVLGSFRYAFCVVSGSVSNPLVTRGGSSRYVWCCTLDFGAVRFRFDLSNIRPSLTMMLTIDKGQQTKRDGEKRGGSLKMRIGRRPYFLSQA